MFSMIVFINLFKLFLAMMIMMNCLFLNKIFLMKSEILILVNETFMNFKNMMLILDMYSVSFFLIISIVVMNVLSFMNMYMYMNKKMKTFFLMTKMFIFSMFLLVYSFNLWTMIIGWEGLGMSSFYLIFYYNNYESWKSGIKTFINNKIGDCMIIISMLYMILYDFSFKMMVLFFLISMLTKSAQYPFMAWLPMAMSAPTPISAMVHSSTLVTASLFIMFRLMNNFLNKFNINFVMNLVLMSMLISGMKAISEKDMKKMIALSTLSQISLIFFFLLNNMKMLAFIYMCNHALFKSLMFINMGLMMMNNFSNQLKFNMKNINLSSMYMLSYKISCFNLMNMSFFSSFFIKEKMIMMMENNIFSMLKFFVFLINSFITMNYSLKMIFFFNSNNYKMKMNMSIISKNYIMSFFFMNILSMIFSKMVLNMILCMQTTDMMILLAYIFSMMMNFKIYKNNFLLFNSMGFLNYMIFMYPLKMMNNSLDFNELWMEKLSLNFYFFMKNKMVSKTFNMNLNMIMILFLMLMSL